MGTLSRPGPATSPVPYTSLHDDLALGSDSPNHSPEPLPELQGVIWSLGLWSANHPSLWEGRPHEPLRPQVRAAWTAQQKRKGQWSAGQRAQWELGGAHERAVSCGTETLPQAGKDQVKASLEATGRTCVLSL